MVAFKDGHEWQRTSTIDEYADSNMQGYAEKKSSEKYWRFSEIPIARSQRGRQ